MRVRKLCYTGSFEPTKMKLVEGVCASEDVIPKDSSTNYKSNGSHKLPAKKRDDIKQMYTKFIQRDKWPDFLL